MINYKNLVENAKNRIPLFSKEYDDLINRKIIDNESGNHIIFGYAFTPTLIELIKKKDNNNIKSFFTFIEEMASSDDIHVVEVCDQSIIEALYDEFGDDIEQFMGSNTKDGLKAVKEYMY